MANISDYIGKYGSALGDSNAYKDAVELETSKKYSLSSNESQKILSFWNKKQNGGTSTNSSGGGSSSATPTIANAIGDVQAYSSKLSMGSGTDIMDLKSFLGKSTEELGNFFGKEGGILTGTKKLITDLTSKAISEGTDILNKEVELRGQINSQLGVAGDLSKKYRETIMDSLPGVVAMGYGFQQLSDLMVGLAEKTGKFTTLNATVVADTAKTSRAFVGDLSEMAEVFSTFSDVGIGAEKSLEAINEAGKKSISLGLNGKKTVSDMRENIGKLNEFGFKNGVAGLERMVQRATEFKIKMSDVLGIAEKVMDPEGAINLSANMQVLGGAIGDFGDPLKMMYDATNNVEGLQDALIGAAGSLATYNGEQGRFEITGVNLRRARAMAQELGMSLGDLTKGAVAAAERTSAATALMGKGLKLDDKQTEFITNLARMKDGTMTIDVSSISKEFGGAQSIALDQLTDKQVKILEDNQKKLEGMSIEEIARDQFTATQNLELNVSSILSILKVQFAKAASQITKTPDEILNATSKYIKGAREGEPGNKGGEMISALKSEGLKGVIKPSSKKQQSLTVDNKTKTTTTEEKTNTLGITKADLKEVMMDVHTSTKNDKNRPITINNNLEPTNPLDYLSYKI
jgi:hypothetical protein